MAQLNSQASLMLIDRNHRIYKKIIVWKNEFEIQNPLMNYHRKISWSDLLLSGRVVLEARLYC